MGVAIEVNGLTKSFGSSRIWEDVTLDIPAGEVSVLLGPSGTGKSVFLKSLIGLLRPERGSINIDGTDIIECSAKELYEIRTLFGGDQRNSQSGCLAKRTHELSLVGDSSCVRSSGSS